MSAATETINVHTGELELACLTWGRVDAPLALLVHGYPDTAWTWRHLGPALAAQGWRAVAPFTRGYGPSDLAPDDRYRARELTGDVIALHEALGGTGDAVLVGHDWGAVAAWGVSAMQPERFAKIVCLAVPPASALLRPFSSPRTVGLGLRQLRMSWYMGYNQLPVERSLDRAIPSLWRAWSPGYDASEDVAHVLAALDTPARRRAALRYYRDSLQRDAKGLFTTRPRAKALYLHGEDDGCLQADIAALAELPDGSAVERLADVGHFLHLEDPARINARILDWVGAPRGV